MVRLPAGEHAPGKRPRHKWLATGERSKLRALAVIAESGVDRLATLANIGALTATAISTVTAGQEISCERCLRSWLADTGDDMAFNTRRKYQQYLDCFFEAHHCRYRPIHSISRQCLTRFVNEAGHAMSTADVRLAAVRALWSYAAARGWILGDISKTLRIRKWDKAVRFLETKTRLPVTEAEYRKLTDSRIKNRVEFWHEAIVLSYWTGLRMVDCACLEWDSITPDFIVCWTKKSGRRVNLPLSDPLIGSPDLLAVVKSILTRPREDPVFVFPLERAAYISGGSASTYARRLFDMVGVTGKSFHGLRHAAASRWAAAGRTIEDIAKGLGHSSTDVTKGYIHEA